MTHLQGVNDGVAEFADAELQRAAVPYERAHMQSDRVLHGRDRRVGGQKSEPPARLDEEIERVGGDERIAVHERQVRMQLTDERKRFAACAPLSDLRQQIGGEIRICAQAQHAGRRFIAGRRRDQLRDDVQPSAQRIARHMRVVRAEIVLLQVIARPATRRVRDRTR